MKMEQMTSLNAPESEPTEAEKRRGPTPLVKVLIGIVGLALLAVVGSQLGGKIPEFAQRVNEFGIWAPIIFGIGYAIAVVAFVPGSLLTLAAGAVFGLVRGTVIVFVFATLGSAAAFLISRYFARNAIEEKLAGNHKFAAIDKAVGKQGLKIVFLLRLSPAFPFSLLNYALGLTKVSFRDYFIASIGMLPGTFLYIYYGHIIGDVAALAGGVQPERGLAGNALLGVGLLATILVTALVTRIARRALEEATHE